MEFIIWARKPISEATEFDNVVRWGTGSVNCGKCMMPSEQPPPIRNTFDGDTRSKTSFAMASNAHHERVDYVPNPSGRFPANVLCMDDALGEGSRYFDIDAWAAEHGIAEDGWADAAAAGMIQVPKPSRAEKEAGLDDRPGVTVTDGRQKTADNAYQRGATVRMNAHPSVKPVRIFSYLIHLLCPSGGLVLDPFCGSGTAGVAAVQSGYQFIGCDMEQEYCEIARARIEHAEPASKTAGGPAQLQIAGM